MQAASKTPRVLLCDDDRELTQLLREYLARYDFAVDCVEDAETMLQRLAGSHTRPDVVVLDLMLPGIDGLAALKTIRQTSNLPVLMMSGRGEPIDRVIGLEVGADDYLAKPCFPRELLARLHALLRRGQDDRVMEEIVIGNLRLSNAERRASIGDEVLSLTAAEFAVLAALMRHAGAFVPREILTEMSLHRPLARFDRAIDVHVSRLRKKLQQASGAAPAIESARGAGYMLVAGARERVAP
jgi:two-component system, OmpR family, response regulator CpxR